MALRNRLIQVAILGALAAVFAVPPQIMHAQESTEVKRKIKSQVTPVYPDLARRMNLHGKVKLQVTIGADGNVKSVHVLGGHPVLVSASQEAVKQWKFEPAAKESTQIVEVNFE